MARTDSIAEGSYAHVCNRGTKKLPILRQRDDLWRLFYNLYYLNTVGRMPEQWVRELQKHGGFSSFVWPEEWGPKEPLVAVLAFCILPNHFHLLLKEVRKGGISKFMHRFTMAYSKFINEKYNENGNLFQGPYRMRVITDNTHLRYLAAYIMVKNTFEIYPKGFRKSLEEFDNAYVWAKDYQFSSLGSYVGSRQSPIITKDILGEIFEKPKDFKKFARECMLYQLDQLNSYEL